VIGCRGGGEFSRYGKPHRGYRRDQVQRPPVDPTMPAGLGPMCCGIEGRMRDKAWLPIRLVPHPTVGPQRGTIDGRSPTTCRPGLKEGNQVTSHPTNLGWQGAGAGRHAPRPRPPRGRAAMLQQQGASGGHLRGGLVPHGQPRMHARHMSANHADQRFQKHAVRIELRPAPALLRWWRGHGNTGNQLAQGDKERVSR
jgi:hypothetical protein